MSKRTVLITGTSAGFGMLAAVELAKRGWHVIATMRNLERRGRLDAAIAEAGVAANVDLVQLDVTDPDSIARGVADTLALTGGKLDAVVNNAGVAAGGAFEDIPDADLRRVIETNFFGVLGLTRALLPTFRKQRAGRIVFISSEAGFNGQPANSIYVASKWALEGWVESIAYELEQFGIELVLVEPGPYVTDIWQASPRVAPADSPYRRWSENAFRAGDAHVAADGGDPQDVAVKIAKVLEVKHPRFRNPVHRTAHYMHIVRGKLPSRWIKRGVEAYLGLRKVRL
ncbi:SDR family NAD(P)-dependent oxidoreductase [Hyphomicrobium sp. D-2]|uniref:SDR family NAD(P)-dependent oxidoreductase n=1 Tax=Hyphomicrobium sp. D-2 TaxID=3041621 RepID=UPI00245806E9|nr:SDR family NAD(P)-dependent oxidoreductase [Hyphomicrobium sp. D-2]MDH4983356.1 SDR family NAD(P)-dependent oxidoreductase [Hyphomicrobium sp. D-2]